MGKKNQWQKKQRRAALSGQEQHIRYHTEIRVLFVIMLAFCAPLLFIIIKNDVLSALLIFLPLMLSQCLMTLYAFRFGVWFCNGKDEIRVRKLFGRIKSIPLADIEEIYTSTDGKANWLNLITAQGKIHVNKSACDNAVLLQFFLHEKCPNAFTPARTKKEYHLL